MTAREFYVLDAVNIATTIHQVQRADKAWGFQATAAQIAEVLRDDDRIAAPFQLTTVQVGAALGRLARRQPLRHRALVERVGTRRWRLTDAGVEVLCA